MKFDNTYGALFVGLLVSTILFGITNVQTITFFHANPRDPTGHKITVAVLWLFDLLHLVFTCHSLYIALITEPQLLGQLRVLWSCKALFVMEILTISMAQILYTLRICKLTQIKRKVIPYILVVFPAVTLALGLLASYKVCRLPPFKSFDTIAWSIYLCLGSTCLTDIVIGSSLIYTLAQYRTGFAWTDSTLTALTSYALNTGIIASILSTAAIIAFAKDRQALIFLAIRIVLSTAHVNSFMAMLNARHYFQSRDTPSTLVLQAHEASINISKFGEVHATMRNPLHSEKGVTINEAGLPLFKVESSDSGGNLSQVVEVVVAKEESTTCI